MHLVQSNLAFSGTLKWVHYKDNDNEEVAVGYNVCYDVAVSLSTPEGWDEEIRQRTVTKPKTANLSAYAGVVVQLGRRTKSGTDYSRDVLIAVPTRGEYIKALTHANMTTESTVLQCANDDWGLVAQTLTSAQITTTTVGIASETANTSSTLANKWLRFI